MALMTDEQQQQQEHNKTNQLQIVPNDRLPVQI
jgi:hypothetical protein